MDWVSWFNLMCVNNGVKSEIRIRKSISCVIVMHCNRQYTCSTCNISKLKFDKWLYHRDMELSVYITTLTWFIVVVDPDRGGLLIGHKVRADHLNVGAGWRVGADLQINSIVKLKTTYTTIQYYKLFISVFVPLISVSHCQT